MSYRIVLFNNGKKSKVIHKSKNLGALKNKYIALIRNNEVIIPRKYVVNQKLKSVNYELMLLESKDVSKNEVVVRDMMGKIIRNREVDPGWLALEKTQWKVEETFKVFGRTDRLTCTQIAKELLLPNKVYKQVYCLLNKLIIEDDNDHIEVITCKNRYDAGRLHDALQDITINFGITSAVFFGAATPENRSELYPKLMKFTGWSKMRLYRNSTRP